MLGLRHYRGFAIDLWQGEIELFSTDILAHLLDQDVTSHPQKLALTELRHNTAAISSNTLLFKDLSGSLTLTSPGIFPARTVLHQEITGAACEADYFGLWQAPFSLSLRHLSFWAIFSDRSSESLQAQATMAFTALKNCFDQSTNSGKTLGRVTFVFPDSQSYAAFQKVFFVVFPEEI